jgi:hypothetical protein
MLISAADVARFHEDGVLLLRGAISPEWRRFLDDAAQELEDAPGPLSETVVSESSSRAHCESRGGGSSGSGGHRRGAASGMSASSARRGNQASNQASRSEYFTDMEMAQRLRAFDEFARRGPCAEIAGALMRSDRVHFLYDQYFGQRANFSKSVAPSTPWHQDQPYWQVSGEQVISIWTPLDPTPPGYEVQFIKGSHRWQEHSPFHFGSGDQYAGTDLPRLPNIDDGVAQGLYEVLSFPDAMPGDVVVFSAMTVHGQAPGSASTMAAAAEAPAVGIDQKQGQKSNFISAGTRRRGRKGKHKGVTTTSNKPSMARFRRFATRFTGDDARYFPRKGEAADVVPSTQFPCDLEAGDEMECERFPLVWTRWDGLVSESSRL